MRDHQEEYANIESLSSINHSGPHVSRHVVWNWEAEGKHGIIAEPGPTTTRRPSGGTFITPSSMSFTKSAPATAKAMVAMRPTDTTWRSTGSRHVYLEQKGATDTTLAQHFTSTQTSNSEMHVTVHSFMHAEQSAVLNRMACQEGLLHTCR